MIFDEYNIRNDLGEIRYLWKLDNKEWVRERKEQWRYLVENQLFDFSAKEKRKLKSYFVNAQKEGYIGYHLPYFLTPFQSPETAKEVFWSNLLDSRGKEVVLSSFLDVATRYGEGLPWQAQHIRFFVEGVLGSEFQYVEDKTGSGQVKDITPEPTFWCRNFIRYSIEIMENEKAYHGVIEAIDYFVSALRYATKAKWRRLCEINRMIVLAKTIANDSNVSDGAKDVAQKIKDREQAILENWALNSHLDQQE